MSLRLAEFYDIGSSRAGSMQAAGDVSADQGTLPAPSTSSQQSAAFAAATRMIRVTNDGASAVVISLGIGPGSAVGSRINPVAVATGALRIAAGQTEYYGVAGGNKLAYITSSA